MGRLGSGAGREGEGVAVPAPGGQAEGGRVQEGRRRMLRQSKDGVTGQLRSDENYHFGGSQAAGARGRVSVQMGGACVGARVNSWMGCA